MAQTALTLELDETEAEALLHYMLWTLDDFQEGIEEIEYDEKSPLSSLEFHNRRKSWPDLLLGILREVEHQQTGLGTFTQHESA